MSILFRAALVAGAFSASVASAGPVAFAIAEGGSGLLRIDDVERPAEAVAVPVSGLDAPLAAIAWRPMTGEIYGYGVGRIYRIEPTSGTATLLVALDPAPAMADAPAGFDFNNRIDAARVVTAAGDNLVFDPKNSPETLTRFTDLFYAEGDANVGRTPQVFASGYTNAVPNAQTTLQYVIDAATGSLATLANNEGRLATVGRLTLDGMPLTLLPEGELDIVSAQEGDNRAFALLTTAAGAALYRVPLEADAQGRVALEKLGDVAPGARGLVVFEPGRARLVQ